MAIEITSDCIKAKSPKISCNACVADCSFHALSVQNNQIHILQENCTQCGMCVVACPVNAINGNVPQRRIKNHTLYSDSKSVITAKELLLYAAAGITCLRIHPDHQQWLATANQANLSLHALAHNPFKIELADWQQDTISYSRRSLLGLRRMQQALSVISIKDRLINKAYSGYQLFHIQLDINKCTLCTACTRLCPTKSLQLTSNAFELVNNLCVNCQACVDCCPENALKIHPQPAKQQITRYNKQQLTCSQCQNSYSALSQDAQFCPACLIRNKLKIQNSLIGQNFIHSIGNKKANDE